MRNLASRCLLGALLTASSLLLPSCDTGQPTTGSDPIARSPKPVPPEANPTSEAVAAKVPPRQEEKTVVRAPKTRVNDASRDNLSEQSNREREETAIGSPTPDSLRPELRGLLTHEDASVRIAAACHLLIQRPEPRDLEEICRILEGVAGDKNAAKHFSTGKILDYLRDRCDEEALEPEAARFFSLSFYEMYSKLGVDACLFPLLRVDSPVVRSYAAAILESAFDAHGPHRDKTLPHADEIVPVLIGLLREKHASARVAGAKALGSLGPDANAALAELEKLLLDESREVRLAVIDALGRIGGGGEQGEYVVPALVAKLDDESGRIRAASARALGRIGVGKNGPHAWKVVPRLISLLDGKDPDVRCAAAGGLQFAGWAAAAALPDCIELLDDEESIAVRVAAARTIIEIWRSPVPAVPAVVFRHPNNPEPYRLPGPSRGAPKAAIPGLVELLAEKDSISKFVAGEITRALGEKRGHH